MGAPTAGRTRCHDAGLDRTLPTGVSRIGQGSRTGVQLAPALAVGELNEATSSGAELIPDLRPADPADIPKGFGVGFRATVPMIDMPQYLDYLTRRLAAAGCQIEEHPVRSLADAADAAPSSSTVPVSARRAHGDDTVRPLFGQQSC